MESRIFCEQLVTNTTEKFLSKLSHIDGTDERFSHLRQTVARLEFNAAQAQAALDVVAHDRAADRGKIRDLQVNRSLIYVL